MKSPLLLSCIFAMLFGSALSAAVEDYASLALRPRASRQDVETFVNGLVGYVMEVQASARAELRARIRERNEDVAAAIPFFDMNFLNHHVRSIPDEHIAVLLSRLNDLGDNEIVCQVFGRVVVNSLISRKQLPEETKGPLLNGLKLFPRYIVIIERMNWESGGESLIIKSAKADGEKNLVTCIKSLSKIATPEAVEVLNRLLSKLEKANDLFEAHSFVTERKVAGIEWKEHVSKAWIKVSRNKKEKNPERAAVVAARYGHKDALILVSKIAKSPPNPNNKAGVSGRDFALKEINALVASPMTEPLATADWVLKKEGALHWSEAQGRFSL